MPECLHGFVTIWTVGEADLLALSEESGVAFEQLRWQRAQAQLQQPQTPLSHKSWQTPGIHGHAVCSAGLAAVMAKPAPERSLKHLNAKESHESIKQGYVGCMRAPLVAGVRCYSGYQFIRFRKA